MKDETGTREERILFPRTVDANGQRQPAATTALHPGPRLHPSPPQDSPQTHQHDQFDQLYIQRPRLGLLFIVAAYLIVGALFAVRTPAWQTPDEPAHYNYIEYIAANQRLPVLEMGDYNQEYLNLLLQTGFAPKLSIESLRYENYQPPLYYLLTTPVYWVFGGSIPALRLFGVLLGVVSICLIYFCLETVFPDKTLIVLGASAFAALLPMHVAMLGAVNNDGLANLLLLAALLVLLRWLRDRFYGGRYDAEVSSARAAQPPAWARRIPPFTRRIFAWYRREPLLLYLGILLGLGMITKIYAYVLLPISLVAVVGVLWLRPRVYASHRELSLQAEGTRRFQDWRQACSELLSAIGAAMRVAIPALLIPLPMWLRNVYLYGAWDFLGLNWHDQVVVGQLRTSEFIATHGWVEYSERAYSFTFKSFWGVFGWMGVFMDDRIYTALLIFSGVIFMGILWATVRFISGGADTDMDFFQLCVLCLLGLVLTAVILSYLWYNVKYVQHQGRYFLWGLLPISVIVALGWREVLHPLQGVITGLLATVLTGAMLGAGYMTGYLDKWTVLSIGLIACVLLVQPIFLLNRHAPDEFNSTHKPAAHPVQTRATDEVPAIAARPDISRPVLAHPLMVRIFAGMRVLVWALPFLLLFLLDLLIPSIFIIPQLAR